MPAEEPQLVDSELEEKDWVLYAPGINRGNIHNERDSVLGP